MTATHQIRCDGCNQPMVWCDSRTRWDGDYEVANHDYRCPTGCRVSGMVTYRTYIPTVDVAQVRPL
jgi:hypothetical protein